MLRISIITLFPEALAGYLESSILGRAQQRGIVRIDCIDPRRWAGGRHRVVDDRPYGGGPGMVLAAPPIARCLDAVLQHDPRARLLLTEPQGPVLDQARVRELADEQHLVVLCGHYEGIDARIRELYRPECFSIGELIISGGELAAAVLSDAVTRLQPGALGCTASAEEESFAADGTLDHPCYTRPEEFRGLRAPEVLLSGDHEAIARWRAAFHREEHGGPGC